VSTSHSFVTIVLHRPRRYLFLNNRQAPPVPPSTRPTLTRLGQIYRTRPWRAERTTGLPARAWPQSVRITLGLHSPPWPSRVSKSPADVCGVTQGPYDGTATEANGSAQGPPQWGRSDTDRARAGSRSGSKAVEPTARVDAKMRYELSECSVSVGATSTDISPVTIIIPLNTQNRGFVRPRPSSAVPLE